MDGCEKERERERLFYRGLVDVPKLLCVSENLFTSHLGLN